MWTPKVGAQAWMEGEEAHSAENVGKTTLQVHPGGGEGGSDQDPELRGSAS
jgi:hypothetical protein